MVTTHQPILFGPLPPPYGGVSVFMNSIRDAAIDRGVHIWAYTGECQHHPNVHFVNHRRFGHLFELIRRGQDARITDSTHFHLEYPHPALLPLWLTAKSMLRFRWVKLLHDGSLPSRFESFSPMRRRLFKTAIRNIDEFIVVSSELESWLRQVAHFNGNVSMIPPLLPLPANTADDETSPVLAEKAGKYAAHKKRVLSIGVFTPAYGFDQVAEAVQRLRGETKEDIGLLLVDGAFDDEAGYRERVLHGRDWITVGESVAHRALQRLYAMSDVFVRAFEHESFGLSRIESIWSNTPVIATGAGETRGMLTYDFGEIDRLTTHLKAVLFGELDMDIAAAAAMFRTEAEENLENYLKAITGANAK